jgi:HSP20 family protein
MQADTKGKEAVYSATPEIPWTPGIKQLLEHAWIPTSAIRRWRRPWMPDEWMPDTDVFEREGKLVVSTDLPGVKREDVQVGVEGETLVIHGHRKEEKEVQESGYHHTERRTGTFTRTVALPDGIDPAGIEATYSDGVLEVAIPKPAEGEPKSFQVPVR